MGTVLLFHVNIFQTNQIAGICQKLQLTTKSISKDEYQKPLSVLAGIAEQSQKTKNSNLYTYSGPELEHEMMVFSGMDSTDLDHFLEEYTKAGIAPIPRKAILTSSNILWTPLRLYRELDEHAKQ